MCFISTKNSQYPSNAKEQLANAIKQIANKQLVNNQLAC